jgi:hypothetical protein
MCFQKKSFILFFSLIAYAAQGQASVNSDSVLPVKQPDSLLTIHKSPFRAAGIVLGTNLGVWSYDHFVQGSSYAQININTIKDNFRTGFSGDNDGFMTNLLSHPYHGGAYFDAARSNGMSFWQSAPYSTAGSLMWEFFMENEPAAINDVISSGIGGPCMGEIGFRISDLVIDDRAIGFDRFKRELLLTIISPIRGLNRLLSGEAWKHRNITGRSLPKTPITFYATSGYHIFNGTGQAACYDLGIDYGDPFNAENEKPYDYFSIRLSGNFSSQQSIIGRVSIVGMLCSKDLYSNGRDHQLTVGIFQYFNYYEINPVNKNSPLSPYKLAETASAGSGLLYQRKLTNHVIFTGSAHVGALLLGGYPNDYDNRFIRTYNMGSGFSSKLNLGLQVGNRAILELNTENYQIYSWIEYLPHYTEQLHANERGYKGSANLSVARLNFNYKISHHFLLAAETTYYYRKNKYKYYPDVTDGISENKVSVGYIF